MGRLLLKAGANAAKEAKAIEEIIRFLNRIGHGDAVKWLKSLDLMQYQGQLLEKFHALMDKLVEALRAIKERLGSLTSAAMQSAIDLWIKRFGELKALSARKIPQALKELNARLKRVQQAIYKGEWHGVQPGSANVTREAEARLVDEHAPLPKPKRAGYAQNKLSDYQHVEGWPDLREYTEKLPRGSKAQPRNSVIEAFSGSVEAVQLKPGQTVYRILNPRRNYKASPWWLETMPETPEEWRTLWAVLDKFNINSFVVKYTIPEGAVLKAWKGKAAEQFDDAAGQFLPGGGQQLFIEFPANIKAEILALPALSTGWGRTVKLFGYEDTKAARLAARTEQLGSNEIESKKPTTTN